MTLTYRPTPFSRLSQDPSPIETALVVDDDRINRMAIAEILTPDFRVLLARDGEGALQILNQEAVSLVLLDVSMPGLSGYEVLVQMKREPGLKDIPVIFITGMSEETDEEYGLLLGAADYVQKPVRPAIVRARVQTQINLLRQRRALQELVLRDGLTGITNRRGFDEALDRALRNAKRHGQVVALGLFDVDHFKQYNDHYGHGAGDVVLKQVAFLLGQSPRRASDVLARYGGEEFVLMMPGCESFAAIMAEACTRIRNASIPHQAASSGYKVLTISGGGILWRPGCGMDGADLLAQADAMLYRAKDQGRNCTLVSGEEGALGG